jgi:hypothetical protein
MSNSTVQFVINVTGNAQKVINGIQQTAVTATRKVYDFSESMAKIRDAGLAFEAVNNMFGRLTAVLDRCTEASNRQQEAEAKLSVVMRNTMGATDEQIQSIKDLAAAQQQLGVIGDEVQLAGAQELGTYLEETESLKKLMPVVNDMLAQQYGLNASQEQAAQVATMMGKVMEGQVGGLSRYGYKFDEAQEKILKYGTEAQKVETLAEVISQSVGGMNEALAATPEGQIKQAENALGDLQERIGKLWIRIKADLMPVVERLMNVVSKIIGFLEEHSTVFGALAAAIATVIAVTKAWTIAQGILNVVLTMNPIGIVIMLIAALIAAIVAVVSKTEGWGETWGNLMEYIKVSFQGAGVWFQKIWLQIEDFFMTGFEAIEDGWYRLQSLWDADTAAEGLARLQAQRDERAAKIAEKQKEFLELAKKQMDMEIWQVKWKESDGEKKAGLAGTMAGLMESANDGLIKPGKNTDLDTKLNKSATATATGGTRNTTVNINLGKMVESIVFNGGYEENEQDMEQRLAAMLSRILGMAEATAG